MTKLTTVVHHELDEQLFFTWLWCGYHDLIRQAHAFTIHLDKRLQQERSPFFAYHEAGRHLWRAVTRLPRQLDSENNNESSDVTLTRLTKKSPLFLLIYQGLWLENYLAYAQEAASAALLFYVYYEPIATSHHSLMQLHTKLSQWIVNAIHTQQIEDTQIKSCILFYFHDYTAKTIQAHQTLPQPPVITLLKNELMVLCENSKKNRPNMFGHFSNTALQTVSAICPNQQKNSFLMTFLDAIARVYVYAAYRNTMEQMLACEQATLLKFLSIPTMCGLVLINSLFFKNNLLLLVLQLNLLFFFIRYVSFFFLSHAFDHYYNGCELVSYLQRWTPAQSEESFLYWHQTLHLNTTALSIPKPEKIVLALPCTTPEYWYPGNYTRVIYHRLRALTPKPTPITSQKNFDTPAILTWTINGVTYSNEQNNHRTHAFAIDQTNLPANTSTAYFAAIHPEIKERFDTRSFQHLLEGRLAFAGKTGQGIKMLEKNMFELKTVGKQGKNDQRMISDPQPYSAKERSTARLLLFSRAPMNHTQVKNHLSLPPILR